MAGRGAGVCSGPGERGDLGGLHVPLASAGVGEQHPPQPPDSRGPAAAAAVGASVDGVGPVEVVLVDGGEGAKAERVLWVEVRVGIAAGGVVAQGLKLDAHGVDLIARERCLELEGMDLLIGVCSKGAELVLAGDI
jgi:hypothetical protein